MQAERIVSIRRIGFKPSMDLEVKSDNHIFYGNGIATSNSHGVSYSIVSYQCAFIKAHFPVVFYASWLREARNKPDFTEEASELISDAKAFNVEIKIPSIISGNENFEIENGKIRFGLGAIKGVGEKAVQKLSSSLEDLAKARKKKVCECSWLEILLFLSPLLNKTVFTNLICAGAISHLGMYRQRMLYEYNTLLELTGKKELPWLQENIDSFHDLSVGVEAMAETKAVSSTRKQKVLDLVKTLKKPTSELKDNEGWVADTEIKLFGISLSCNKLDVCDTSGGDTTCAEFKTKEAKQFSLAVVVNRVSEYIPKSGKLSGQKMLYLTLSDQSGSIEAVAFPDSLRDYEHLLFKGNTVCVIGKRSNKGGLTLSKVVQI